MFIKFHPNLSPYLSNQYVYGLLILFLILYGSLARQELPNFMYRLFDNPFFTLLIVVMIAFLGTQDLIISILVGLIFVCIMHNFNQKKITEGFINGLHNYQIEEFVEKNLG